MKSYVKSFKLTVDELKYYSETKENYEKLLGFKLVEKQFFMILLAEINHSMNTMPTGIRPDGNG